jgi:hypothetical protein
MSSQLKPSQLKPSQLMPRKLKPSQLKPSQLMPRKLKPSQLKPSQPADAQQLMPRRPLSTLVHAIYIRATQAQANDVRAAQARLARSGRQRPSPAPAA